MLRVELDHEMRCRLHRQPVIDVARQHDFQIVGRLTVVQPQVKGVGLRLHVGMDDGAAQDILTRAGAEPVRAHDQNLRRADTGVHRRPCRQGLGIGRQQTAAPVEPQRFPIDPLHDGRQNVAGLHKLRHPPARRTEEHLVPRPLLNHPAVVVHDDPLPERKDIGQVMRHDKHRNVPELLHLRQFLPQDAAQGCIQGRERLVEQQQGGLHGQRPRQRHPLLLAAGELSRPVLGPCLQVETFE